MAVWNVKGYQRKGRTGTVHSVDAYTQNRKEGRGYDYVKKGYTACQTDIAEVINRDLSYNATVETLRTDHAWRNYVCNCKTSRVYDIATTGVAGPDSIFRNNPVKGADYTYTNKKGKRVTVKGIIAQYNGFYATSSCGGIKVWVPARQAPLSGKQIVFLKTRA